MSPVQIQTLLQQAVTHHRANRLKEAAALYRRLETVAPRHFDVLNLSGLVAYQQQRPDDAIRLLTKAHGLNPRHAGCAMHCGLALVSAKRHAEAEVWLRRAVEIDPNYAEGWENLAYGLKLQDRLLEAIACHERVGAINPGYARGWYNYGLTLSLAGRAAQALICHERAIAADPRFALARFGLGQAMIEQHRIAEGVASIEAGLALDPGNCEARSHRLFALHSLDGVSREQLFAEHRSYGRSVGGEVERTWRNAPEPGRRLRIAVLSPDFREHSCAFFIEPILRHLDRRQFELYLYHDHFREDATTARIRALADGWRNFVGRPASAVEAEILADAPDVIIDLAGHTGLTNRLPLFARRLAPVQITYLGYPNTTGVPAMDYRFTDEMADPAGEPDALATETLVRFAPTAWTYSPPASAPPVGATPCLARGAVTLGCFNNPGKLSDATVRLWAKVLGAIPTATLRLKGKGLDQEDTRARLLARFAAEGVAAGRVELIGQPRGLSEHLACYHDVDIALDPFPYHGTTTTCEALWMGVPVVALVGDRHQSRVGLSLLKAAGHPDWAAATEAEYIATVIRLAGNPADLAEVRAGLRGELERGPLLDHSGQAERFGAALRECWINWCVRQESEISSPA